MCTCREPTSNLLYPLHLCGHYLTGTEQMVYDLLRIAHPGWDVVAQVVENVDGVAVAKLVEHIHRILRTH